MAQQPPRLTRIQIDCGGAPQQQQQTALFAGLPLGKTKEHSTTAERQGLLYASDVEKTEHSSCPFKAERLAGVFLYVACALLMIALVVFLGLFYMRVSEAVASIDNAVSIKSSTVSMIRNVDSILNRTAELSKLANRVGAVSLEAALTTTPLLHKVMNLTVNTVQDVHSLIQKPTIHIGRR